MLAASKVEIFGGAGADTVTVDFRNGDFNPPDGILFDGVGADPGDLLTVISNNGTVQHSPAGGGSGHLPTDGVTIDYLNLAPVVVENAATFTLITPNSC